MDAPTADARTAEKLLSAQSDVGSEINNNNLVDQQNSNSIAQIEQSITLIVPT